jgi:glutamyl/glutaminyl-tRNA synthetase
LEYLESLSNLLEKYEAGEWDSEIIKEKITTFILENKLFNGDVLWPLRVALTGQEKSPPPFEVAEILGRQKTLERIKKAAESLKKAA